MNHQHRGRAGHARRTEPSWPTVIATTLRLWLERHPVVVGGRAIHVRLRVLAATLILAVAAVATGALVGVGTIMISGPRPAAAPAAEPTASSTTPRAPTSAAASLSASVAARNQAAAWIVAQVAPSAIVACDPAMCATLQASGIPAARLLILGTAAADPLGSDVVVATLALRNQFGARLESVYAPAVIASFGSGDGRVDVRAIAPLGATAYESALAADLRARMAAGSQFLHDTRILLSASGKAALRAGEVDSRLLLTLAALAAQQPVRVVAFTDPSPAASPAIPLRGVEIAPVTGGPQGKARLEMMLSFLDAQRTPFIPLKIIQDDNSSLNFEYSAPSPLGLLGTA
jgi:hypothetical protein